MHRVLTALARAMAMLGGIVLSLLIIITCLSILGRTGSAILHADAVMGAVPGLAQALLDFGVGPVKGDVEMVEAGMAFAIFAFLPLCQITAGHATVDVFTNGLTGWKIRALQFVIDAVFAAVLVIIAMQLEQGMQRNIDNGQTSLLLQYPIWWGYAAAFAASAVAALIGVYMAGVRLIELVTGREIAVSEGGADH